MRQRSAFYAASGPANSDCYALAQRWDDAQGYDSNEGEFWVLSLAKQAGGDLRLEFGWATTRLIGALWRADSRACFVAAPDGTVRYHPDLQMPDRKGKWETQKVHTGTLIGIWGLDEANVFTWGLGTKRTPRLYRRAGKGWAELQSPGFKVHAMHGSSPDCIYAVGEGGGIARLEGNGWRTFTGPTDETLTSVFVASADQVYAAGWQGSVLEGSSKGWGKIADGPRMPTGEGAPLLAVCLWKKQLWIGGGVLGLLRRKGTSNVLEAVKPNIHAVTLDGRKNLVIAADDFIAQTVNGTDFDAVAKGAVLEYRKGKALGVF
jgi:hypothetical protein